MISKSLLCVCIAVLVGWLLGFGDYRKIWREKNDLVYSLVSQIKKFYRTTQTIEYRSVDERNQNKEDILRIFTKPELFKYKGVNGGPIYLSIFGQVYDVSKGRRHYGPGGAYSFFSGKKKKICMFFCGSVLVLYFSFKRCGGDTDGTFFFLKDKRFFFVFVFSVTALSDFSRNKLFSFLFSRRKRKKMITERKS